MEEDIEVKKKTKKQVLLTIICALPILIGLVLYVVNCSITPNYNWVYDNKVVSTLDESEKEKYYYRIDDDHKCFFASIENNDGIYSTNSDLTELFKVDLKKLENLNSSYTKLMLDFSFIGSIDSNNLKLESYPKINFIIDNNVVKTISFKSLSKTSYKARELSFNGCNELVININSYGVAENSAKPMLNFEELKIKVWGA